MLVFTLVQTCCSTDSLNYISLFSHISVVASALTGLFCWNVFVDYHWTIEVSLLFGSIISATDPVAVVALLKELGQNIKNTLDATIIITTTRICTPIRK